MTISAANIPWERINDFLLSCESAHEIRTFSEQIMGGLKQFIRFDSIAVTYYDVNQKAIDQHSINLPDRLNKVIVSYYLNRDEFGRYDVPKGTFENPSKPNIVLFDWQNEAPSEFVTDVVKRVGTCYTLAFRLFDMNRRVRTSFAISRLTDTPFGSQELELLNILYPHLNNLHKKFFFFGASKPLTRRCALMECAQLTKREKEIVDLLCTGTTPANIAKILHISSATTHKHITHIYSKMRVTSLQELLVRLLSSKG